MFDSGLRQYEYAGNTLYARAVEDGPGIELYAKNGMATTVAQMVTHDGPVLRNGEFVYIEDASDTDVPAIAAVHPWAGHRAFFDPNGTGENAAKLRPLKGELV